MSDVRHVKGTLSIVPRVNDDLEQTAKQLLIDEGVSPGDHFDTFLEQLDWICHNYVIIDKSIYKIKNTEEMDSSEDIYNASQNEDGSLNFEVKFYSAGCSLEEAIEQAVRSLENGQK